MRKLAVAALVVSLTGLVGVARADDKKADPTGTWKWATEVKGEKREMTLKLKLEDGKLTGTISGGKAETKIEDGTYKDGEVSFTVVRERKGEKFTTKYNGKQTGDTIKGTIEFERNGKTEKREWEARRDAK